MDKFRGKKNDQKTAFVENDDNQTINEKNVKSNYDDNLNWITMDNDTIILDRWAIIFAPNVGLIQKI